MKYSVIVPVYNRPEEVGELLGSIARQTFDDLEVIVVDDGSQRRCDEVVDSFRDRLDIHYYFKPNSGPGPTRNFGFEHASGDYLVVFDSDCLLPPTYFEAVNKALETKQWDAWGGPDRPESRFTILQQAMGFTMSAFLTTGGIRGGEAAATTFQPRSFNMGFSRAAYKKTGGFGKLRYAEDIELSIRIRKAGFRIALISEAFVYHKRRTSLAQFYNQVFHFGEGRVEVTRLHPDQARLIHWLPFLFTLGLAASIVLSLFRFHLGFAGLLLYALYFVALFITSLKDSGKVTVALLSIPSAGIQLIGYGLGFISRKMRR